MNNINKSSSFVIGHSLFCERLIKTGKQSSEIYKMAITKIGRKYLFVEGFGRSISINKKTLLYENKTYNQLNIQFYVDKQEIIDIREKSALLVCFQKYFNKNPGCNQNTLAELRKAFNELNIPECKPTIYE